MSATEGDREQLAINTIRTLSMDAVQRADSGHPGTPMALAPVAYVLWNEFLRYDPVHPRWPARDRFVLSCGHASMLLYSLLHLSRVRKVDPNGLPLDEQSVSLEDIRNFRKLGSPCAGHPEYGHAEGIETTTGPLGQGIATSAGMAMAARWLADRYGHADRDLFHFKVYALCSDGDLMEGIASEAASLAGHLRLSNLCWIYDDNHITIEGGTELSFSEDVSKRFEGLGWRTLYVSDANDLAELRLALNAFSKADGRPTLIRVKSVIGFGSPNKANSHDAHGAPLGAAEVRLTKEAYGWPANREFLVPAEATALFAEGIGRRGAAAYSEWAERWEAYRDDHPERANELDDIWSGRLPKGWEEALPRWDERDKATASRNSSGKVLNALAKRVPWLVGGSADLAGSTKTLLEGEGSILATSPGGRNLHFGIREHAMAAISNGMSLTGLRAYCGTFFVFTDYMRPAMRLSSLMHQGVVYVLSHDSIGLGEDGPTHQPVEHLAACRAMPGLNVFRPADANEVAEAYRCAMENRDQPTALVLTRQDLPTLNPELTVGARRGGYVLRDPIVAPAVLLLGTGSEVHLCLVAAELLASEGISARVVSLPCWEVFEAQDAGYREAVLPSSVPARVGVEAGVRQGWDRYLGANGEFVGMDSFGASAPYRELYAHFGITAERIAAVAKATVDRSRKGISAIG